MAATVSLVNRLALALGVLLPVQTGAACSGRGSCPPGQICAPTPLSAEAVCMPPVVTADKAALQTFRAAQPSSARLQGGCLASWSDDTDLCVAWEGVQCCNNAYYVETRVCVLALANCGGLVMTDSIGELDELMAISFDHNAAEWVPPLERLQYMRQISMQGNAIRELPASVGQLQQLSLLQMTDNLLEDLPESLGNATALTDVYLDGNMLARLPNSIGQLGSLKNLLLSNNRLESVPDSLGNLRKLEVLDLSGNSIATLPHACAMDSLHDARFDDNVLQSVPDCFVGPKLEKLRVSRNRVSYLPDLGSSDALELVDATNNSILDLPQTIPDTLTHLYLGANPLLVGPAQFSKWLMQASGIQHLDVSLTSSAQYGPWFTTADGACNRTFSFRPNIPSCTPRIEVRAPAQWSAVTGMECQIGQPCSFSIHIYDNQRIPLRTTLPEPYSTNALSMRVRGTEGRPWQLLHDNRDGTYTATVPDTWLTAVARSNLETDAGVFDDLVRVELRRGVNTAAEVEFFTGMTTSDEVVCTDQRFPDCPLDIRVQPPDCDRELGPFSRLNPHNNATCECREGYYLVGTRCAKQCLHNQQQILINGTVACVCMRGTYNTSAVRLSCTYEWPPVTPPATDICMPCPICAQCDSGLGGPPSVKAGWRGNMTTAGGSFDYGSGLSLDVFVCPDQDEPIASSCPAYALGDPTPECTGNHSGALCAACAAGHSAYGFDCVPCAQLTEISFGVSWTQAASGTVIGCIAFAGIAICVRSFLQKEKNAERGVLQAATEFSAAVLQMREVVWCNVRILVGMFQIVSLLQSSLDVTYPPVFSILCHWMGLVSADSNSLLTLFRFDCYVDPANAFLYGWLVKVFGVPLLITLVILGMYCADKRAEAGVEQDLSSDYTVHHAFEVARTKLKERVFTCVTLLYPWTSAAIISALQCRQLGEGVSVLLHDCRVSCDTAAYTKLYWTACAMMVAVPVGVPVGLYVWMEISIRHNMKAYADLQERQGDRRGQDGSPRIDQERLSTRLFCNPWPISVHDIDNQVDRNQVSSLTFDFSTYNNQRLQAMSFVLYEYRDGWVRYEPCDIARKLILTSGLEFAWRGTSLQRLVACVIAAAFMCIHVHCKPYRESRSNLLKTAADVSGTLLVSIAAFLASSNRLALLLYAGQHPACDYHVNATS